MRGKILTGFLTLVTLGLVALNDQVLNAHQWGSWHWDKSTIGMYVFGSHQNESRAAIADWDSHTQLSLPLRSSHTDVSVFGANAGPVEWAGLASIKESAFDWWHKWCWCKITHAHAQFNSYYNYSSASVQGVQCQEVGHTFGLDHSNTNGCMAKGYYSPSSNFTNSHNWSDVNAMY
jgi:predicted Zn-dependent protease